MKTQTTNSKKGEVEFRRKIYQQQVDGKCILKDEFDAKGIERILRARTRKTYEQIDLLRKSRIALSPYIEIGAERCQRSLVMENDFDANGAAVDISYYSLRSCDYYKDILNKSKAPLRICCDAYSLPFMANSVPFIFCYETLHHFPDPSPIVREVHRVLSPGGYFFFDEEPLKKILHINLFKGEKIYSQESLNASKIRNFIDSFFAKRSCNEIEYGIIENDELSLSDWRNALRFFKEKHVKLQSTFHLFDSELFNPVNWVKFFLACMLGANVSGVCRKSGAAIERSTRVSDFLICPSCIEDGLESKLVKRNSSFFCSCCGKGFPIVEGVIFLFSYGKLESLYPEIFENL